ncbi:hypothetical protein FACS189449_00670 [Alphaproteobacteria bacterium]|nr:hypothetical protein FACS189449_00670 [Alphaproteobacteria bacterium]
MTIKSSNKVLALVLLGMGMMDAEGMLNREFHGAMTVHLRQEDNPRFDAAVDRYKNVATRHGWPQLLSLGTPDSHATLMYSANVLAGLLEQNVRFAVTIYSCGVLPAFEALQNCSCPSEQVKNAKIEKIKAAKGIAMYDFTPGVRKQNLSAK